MKLRLGRRKEEDEGNFQHLEGTLLYISASFFIDLDSALKDMRMLFVTSKKYMGGSVRAGCSQR